jgi:hypothetical protein
MDRHGNDTGVPELPQDRERPGDRAIDSTTRMRRAIAAAAGGADNTHELEVAARALVQELRAAEAPPEQMLLRIKELLADAGLHPSYASDSGQPPNHDAALYRDVIMLSIRHYYEAGAGDNRGVDRPT